MTGTKTEDRLSFLHHIESVAGNRFEIFAVGLQETDFLFTLHGELLKFLKLGFLFGQLTLHLGKTEPFRIESEPGGKECGCDDQNPDHTHCRRQKI